MSLLTTASLVVTPNANKTSKLYSVIPSNGNGDFTVTRATTATRTNSAGLIEVTGTGMVRRDYSLGSCPNLLLEPQRTNLVLYSEQFDNASWTKIATTVTANSDTSPSGVQNADTLTANGILGFHAVQTNATSFTNTTSYSLSVYAKKNTNNFIQLLAPSAIGGMYANFDLNNGVVGSLGTVTGTNPTSSITSVGNGWYKCTMNFTAILTSGQVSSVVIISSASAARAESNSLSTSVFLWGAQLEAGAYATSYIPTTTASVTRNADSISLGNVFTNGLISASGGTWFVELRNNVSLLADDPVRSIWIGTNATTPSVNGTLLFRQGGGSGRIQIWKQTGGAGTSLFTTTTDTIKVALKWNGTTADIFVNGTKVVSATAFPHNNMEFISANVGRTLNINQMALWATPLTDTQLTQLTTL